MKHQRIAGCKAISHSRRKTSLRAEGTSVKYFTDTHNLRDTKSNSYKTNKADTFLLCLQTTERFAFKKS